MHTSSLLPVARGPPLPDWGGGRSKNGVAITATATTLSPFFAACCGSVHCAKRDIMRASSGREYHGDSATSKLLLIFKR